MLCLENLGASERNPNSFMPTNKAATEYPDRDNSDQVVAVFSFIPNFTTLILSVELDTDCKG